MPKEERECERCKSGILETVKLNYFQLRDFQIKMDM